MQTFTKKIIAFDIGDKRIGVAASDPFGSMALPQETYHRKNFNSDVAALASLAVARGAEIIVCGLPLNVDGTHSEQTQKTLSFIEELKKHVNIPIELQDERFSTKEAHRVLIAESMRREKRKSYVDSVAASFILDDYMRKKQNETARANACDNSNGESEN